MLDIITNEMEQWFIKRTENHIRLVQNYCKKLYQIDNKKYNSLQYLAKIHDQSKFREPERSPYILITWCYKVPEFKLTLNENVKGLMNKATEHHVKFNSHHPEFHCKWEDYEILINPENRDSPFIPINCYAMTSINIAEMVCDWLAVSEERNTNPLDWADSNIGEGKRWIFSEKQVDLIYYLINKLYI